MSKDEALDKKAENARELGLDYEPVIDESAAKRIATALGWEPKRTWVGLTDEDIGDEFVRFQIQGGFNRFEYAVKAIEAKLKEKNT